MVNRVLIRKRVITNVNVYQPIRISPFGIFLGILMAVASLSSAGHLDLLSKWLDEKVGNIYVINLIIGVLSSVVDNVPLVAGAIGMYDITTPEMFQTAANPAYLQAFTQDGLFWEFLAYCAGTGGSILIIGYLSGAAVYWVQAQILL